MSEAESAKAIRAAELEGRVRPGLRTAGKHLHPLFGQAMARLGTVLQSKWRLDMLLGLGGMAAVYAATHRNGHRVAIKLLHPRHVESRNVRERFLREGYVGNKVRHPGAVRVLDDGESEEGLAFLVMELLDGESLEVRVRREGPLSAEDAIAVADRLLDVLVAAHYAGVIHRDIKPDNVFLLKGGGLKLLDFGIARLAELSAARGHTRQGALLGTPAYMAPEQARGAWDLVDGRSDLWSAGAILYVMLTGHPVHHAETEMQTLIDAASRQATPVSVLAPRVPAALAAVVDRALAFDQERRFADAEAMQSALRRVGASLANLDDVRTRFDADVRSELPASLLRPGSPATSREAFVRGAPGWDEDSGDITALIRDPGSHLAALDAVDVSGDPFAPPQRDEPPTLKDPAPAGRLAAKDADGEAEEAPAAPKTPVPRGKARTSKYSDQFTETSYFDEKLVQEATRPSFVPDPPSSDSFDMVRMDERLAAALPELAARPLAEPHAEVVEPALPPRRGGVARVLLGVLLVIVAVALGILAAR
ncbi:MAG: serine/threonine-protein kinase [Myxococcota bacterium]